MLGNNKQASPRTDRLHGDGQVGGVEVAVPSPAGVRRRGQVGGVIRRAVHLRRPLVKETTTQMILFRDFLFLH